jgi:signal transduction histidine kinase
VTSRLRLGIAVATASVAGVLVALAADDPGYSPARMTLVAVVGCVMVAGGLVASAGGEHRTGVLAVLGGAAWLAERLLQAVPTDATATAGALLTGMWGAFLAHAVLGFPSGRLASAWERAVVAAGYVVNAGLTVPPLLFEPSLQPFGVAGRNLLLVLPDPDLAAAIGRGADVLTIGWAVLVVAAIVRKAALASPPGRRAYGFVWVAGALLYVNGAVIVAAGLGVVPEVRTYGLWLEIVAGLVPIAMAASLFLVRIEEDRLVGLVVDLDGGPGGARLRTALRRTLADPSLDIVYWREETDGWIDGDGLPVAPPTNGAGRALTPVEHRGERIGALVHDPVLLRNAERVRAAGAAAALALDDERLRAELLARLDDVRASRARIVEAGDRARRRVERNLHDGAQQRLVGLALMLRLAATRSAQDGSSEVGDLVAEAAAELDGALRDLRELARGLHPAIVTDAGLPGALETLAERQRLPVRLSVELPDRLPEPVEVGAYYVVAEALANVHRHAGATGVTITADVRDGQLRVAVSDDGRGGAAPRPGSGLEGLGDRIDALRGHLRVDSPVGSGTTVTVRLPCA